METTNHVIQLAKDRILADYGTLLQEILQDVHKRITQLSNDGNAPDPNTLSMARLFLQFSTKELIKRTQANFQESLSRALRTMYTDLRVSIDMLSIDNLKLIDESTTLREIEVDRLVMRLRDADDGYLDKLNVIIGKLHGAKKMRERENPFRPYVLAKSLHVILLNMAETERVANRLFALLSDAMVNRMTHFYEPIYKIFESNGIDAQVWQKKTDSQSNEVSANENVVIPDAKPVGLNFPEILPIPEIPSIPEILITPDQSEPRNQVQSPSESDIRTLPPSDEVMQISGLPVISTEWTQAKPHPSPSTTRIEASSAAIFALGEQIGPMQSANAGQEAFDAVAALFETILCNTQVPAELRAQIGRLQIPFLKAALSAPGMLKDWPKLAKK